MRYIANFRLTKNNPIQAVFKIDFVPSKVSQLENDAGYITEQALEGMPKLRAIESPSLTSQGGICTWVLENPFETTDLGINLIETNSGLNEYADYEIGLENITVKIGSLNNLEAGAYKIILIG